MPPSMKGIRVAGLLMLMMICVCVSAQSCYKPSRMFNGKCTWPSYVGSGALLFQEVASAPNRKTFKGIQLTTADNYPLKQLTLLTFHFGDFETHAHPVRAQVLELTIGPNEAGETPLWVLIQNNHEYVDEFITTSSTITKTYTSVERDYIQGAWTIEVINWDSTTPVFVRHERFEATLRCTANTDFKQDGTISVCYPFGMTPCLIEGSFQNWNGQGCVSPIIPDDYVVQVDAVDSTSKLVTFTGKAGQKKTLAPKQALLLEFPKHRATKIVVDFINPSGTSPSNVFVQVYYYNVFKSIFNLAREYLAAGIEEYVTAGLGNKHDDGIWKVVIVNWGTVDVEIPFAWLNVEMSCVSYDREDNIFVADFTTQQDGIRACFDVPCVSPDSFKRIGATTECVSVPIKPSKIIPVTLNEASSTNTEKVFGSASGIVTLAPKESVGFVLSGFYSMYLAITSPKDDANADVHIAVRSFDMVRGFLPTGEWSYNVDDGYNSIHSRKGLWQIMVMNVGTTQQTFNFANMRVALSCPTEGDRTFRDSFDGATACFPRCPVGQRYSTNDNMCVEWLFPSQNKFALTPTSESTSTVQKFAPKAVAMNFPFGFGMEYDLSAFRSDNLNLWLDHRVVVPDCDLYVFENDELIDYQNLQNKMKWQFGGQTRSMWFNYTTTGTTGNNKGKWRVWFVRARENGAMVWNPAKLAVELNCPFDDEFTTINGITSCVYVQCENPAHHRGNDGVCVAPDLTTNAPAPLAMKDSGSQSTEINLVGSAATPVTLEPGVAQVIDLSSTRSDKLKVKVGKPASAKVVVQVYVNDLFVDEFKPVGQTQEYTAKKPNTASTVLQTFGMKYGSTTTQQQHWQVLADESIEPWEVGQWKIAVVNWGAAAETFEPSSVSVTLYCADGTSFTGTDVKTCLPTAPSAPPTPPPSAPPTPPPALWCAYTEAVGFNPWEQWNAFALSGNIFLLGSIIEGRIAAAEGGVSLANGAQVHTQNETFISKQADRAVAGPWSISAAGTVTASGAGNVVVSGGVEASGVITGVSSLVAPEKIPLSVDVAAAAEYFRGRSTVWADLVQSWIALSVTAPEIRVQLHGKVNVVNGVKLEDLNKLERITLLGHPTGAVIVNVVGVGPAVFSPDLKVVFEGRDGVAVAPTFGRVVLNMPDATSVEFASPPATAGPRVVHLSFLAPKAAAILLPDAPLLKGNVVANSLAAYLGSELAVQPFGTSARQLARGTPVPPAPKQVWKREGRQRTACLWHVL